MQAGQPGSQRVLIAERDPHVRELQRHFLEQARYAVEFADDGEAALARAREARPDVLITEILIPKLDGLTLCRRLREDPATRDIPVMVFSILAAAARATDAGAQAFVRKPFVETTFLAALRDVIATPAPGPGPTTGTTPGHPGTTEPQWASR